MIGAIFGDIVGSVYEFNNTKQTDFPLLTKWSRPTDDTIMTLAIARGLMYTWGKSDEEIKYGLIRSMQKMGRKYPYAGYGRRFAGWSLTEGGKPFIDKITITGDLEVFATWTNLYTITFDSNGGFFREWGYNPETGEDILEKVFHPI